jgi:glucosylceramidase
MKICEGKEANYGAIEDVHVLSRPKRRPFRDLPQRCLIGAGATVFMTLGLITQTGFFTREGTSIIDQGLEFDSTNATSRSAPFRTLQVVESVFNTSQLMRSVVHHASFEKSKTRSSSRSFIAVDDTIEFQEILGFGGAFTEAASLQFQKLSLATQEEILRLYFSKEGANYAFGRVPMNSCDYSPSSHSFDDIAGDIELDHFDMTVARDQVAVIPFIQRALAIRPDLKLFLSPWSPPAWMKLPDDNGQLHMTGSATPVGLNPVYRSAWALYFSKFISAYRTHNISFWALTPQNEPMFAAPWEACSYNESAEASFVADFLGPRMKADHPDVKILVFDHNRDAVRQRLYLQCKRYMAELSGCIYSQQV